MIKDSFLGEIWAFISKRIRVLINGVKVAKIALYDPKKYNIIDTVIKSTPYEYSDLLEIERVKLIEMRDYFFDANISDGDMKVSKEINLAIKLLDILRNETDYFHFEDPYPNEPKEQTWLKTGNKNTEKWNGDYWARHHKYVCDVYVNTRNASRFVHPSVVKYYQEHASDLYFEKARHLYHLIRERLEEGWSN